MRVVEFPYFRWFVYCWQTNRQPISVCLFEATKVKNHSNRRAQVYNLPRAGKPKMEIPFEFRQQCPGLATAIAERTFGARTLYSVTCQSGCLGRF
jgi:hypothetical protein